MAISEKLALEYEKELKGIGEKFQGVNPAQIEQALKAGGSFSSSLGFNDPRELMGMTPDQFDSLMQNRAQLLQSNLQQVQGAVALRDQLYGISEGRKAAQQMARDKFSAGVESENVDKGITAQKELQKERLDQEAEQFLTRVNMEEDQFNKRMGFEEKWKSAEFGLAKARLGAENQWRSAELGVRISEHNQNMKFNYSQLNEQKRQHSVIANQNSEQNKIAWAGVGLREKEIEALSMQRVASIQMKQQEYNQKELNQTNNYISSLLKTKAMKGGKGDNLDTNSALFFAKLKVNAMSGVSGMESMIEVPEEKHLLSKNKSLFPGYKSVLIAPADGPSWKKGDVLGVKEGDKVDTKPLMSNPARNETSMQILLNKMPGYRMTPFAAEEE